MGRKIENRNIDVTKARGELEEDLLEYVYRAWRQGRQITSKEYAREVNITGYEAAGLVRSLVKKGFLCEPENGHLELSDKGKLEGMECLARHEKLTQFFQMVSGMDQQRAQEDACRVEHYISPEGLKGIENFLQYGDVYDRVYDDMDLYTFYEDGEFPMAFGLYEPERRNPRFLAPEYGKLEHSVILRVKKSQNCFLLKTKKTNPSAMYGTEEMMNGYRRKKKKVFISYRQTSVLILRIQESRLQKQWQSLRLHALNRSHCQSIIGN